MTDDASRGTDVDDLEHAAEDEFDELGEWDVPGTEPDDDTTADPAVSTIELTPELLDAQAAAVAAEEAAVDQADALRAAEDLVADARGVEAVARARLLEVQADKTSARSQVLAAEEAVAKATRDRSRAELRVERLQERAAAAERAVEDAYAQVQNVVDQADAGTRDSGDDDEPALIYPTLPEFVEEFLVPTYRRWIGGVGGRNPNGEDSFWWDAKWWLHPEAVQRLEALWRAFEHLRRDPALGMSVWWRDHADHHMPILLSKFGPFGASKDANERGEPLPHTPPPAGIYDQPMTEDAPPRTSQEP